MIQLLKNRLSPFKHKSYRSFFIVQSLSLVGTWSHELARAWIVIEMLGKAGALGSLLLASAIPSLFLILRGGILVDKIDARRLMMYTRSILALVSLGLAFVTEYSDIQMWHLFVFAIIEGVIVSFDSPAYQTLTVRLVPREDFQQAIAINSTNFHTARMLGPVVAGLLMAWHGPSLVFLFDAISFLGLTFILKNLDLREARRKVNQQLSGWASLLEGVRYLHTDKQMRYMLLQLLITICFTYPIIAVIFRTYIKLKFNLSSQEFGYVFAFPAMGAMLGSISFAFIKPKRPLNALKFGVPGAVSALWLLPLASNIPLAVTFMALTGFFTYLSFASLTVSLHLNVVEEFRGRMGAFIGLGFISIGPLMSFPVGVLADHFGFEKSLYSLATLFGLLSALLALFYLRQQRAENIC